MLGRQIDHQHVVEVACQDYRRMRYKAMLAGSWLPYHTKEGRNEIALAYFFLKNDLLPPPHL